MQKIMFNDKYYLTDSVLSGRKTMTRRLVKCPKEINGIWVAGFHVSKQCKGDYFEVCAYDEDERNIDQGYILPTYRIGETIAIAQSYLDADVSILTLIEEAKKSTHHPYDAQRKYEKMLPGLRNKMFTKADLMPHHIRIKDIKVERLQDISDEDCMKEGIEKRYYNAASCDYYYISNSSVKSRHDVYSSPHEAFASLIDRVSGKGTWNYNPWVWVYEFELID